MLTHMALGEIFGTIAALDTMTSTQASKSPQFPSVALARSILTEEASALHMLAETLGSIFDEAVEACVSLDPRGRIVVCGIGKTGIVGAKISATFASVGLPSFVLHPGEAVHGDLGRLSSEDLVILLSNSGQSSEILRILPHLKRIGVKTLAITSGASSPLAKQSSISIVLPKFDEAGALGLAPTTSTTALLALGDALVMCAAHHRKVSRDLFAACHPGGMLGKTLMLVSELMRREEQLCVAPESLLCKEVLHRITLTKGRPGCAALVNAQGQLQGIFTDGDLRRCLDRSPDFLERPVTEFMSRTPKTASPDTLAEEALRIMNQFQIDQVIVIDDERKPIGLLDIQDIVQVG
jgi:arabinose-5-phosphate isomerase